MIVEVRKQIKDDKIRLRTKFFTRTVKPLTTSSNCTERGRLKVFECNFRFPRCLEDQYELHPWIEFESLREFTIFILPFMDEQNLRKLNAKAELCENLVVQKYFSMLLERSVMMEKIDIHDDHFCDFLAVN